MKKIFITGGAGFIGSHVCEEIFHTFKKSKIIIFDKLTYAGNKLYIQNLINSPRVKFIKGDIKNYLSYSKLLKKSRFSNKYCSRKSCGSFFYKSYFIFLN